MAQGNYNRLKWQCRRGQLELDLILQRFLTQEYPHLPQAEQESFGQLLQAPDTLILQWLGGQTSPPKIIRSIIEKIR